MKIPDKIRIFGFDWTVHFNKEVATTNNVYGLTQHASQKIFLEPGMTTQKNEQTFLHELMHAIWWQTGLSKSIKDREIEEQVITPMAMGLYQVLKENNLLK
jgi:hypothetical protein